MGSAGELRESALAQGVTRLSRYDVGETCFRASRLAGWLSFLCRFVRCPRIPPFRATHALPCFLNFRLSKERALCGNSSSYGRHQDSRYCEPVEVEAGAGSLLHEALSCVSAMGRLTLGPRLPVLGNNRFRRTLLGNSTLEHGAPYYSYEKIALLRTSRADRRRVLSVISK